MQLICFHAASSLISKQYASELLGGLNHEMTSRNGPCVAPRSGTVTVWTRGMMGACDWLGLYVSLLSVRHNYHEGQTRKGQFCLLVRECTEMTSHRAINYLRWIYCEHMFLIVSLTKNVAQARYFCLYLIILHVPTVSRKENRIRTDAWNDALIMMLLDWNVAGQRGESNA